MLQFYEEEKKHTEKNRIWFFIAFFSGNFNPFQNRLQHKINRLPIFLLLIDVRNLRMNICHHHKINAVEKIH